MSHSLQFSPFLAHPNINDRTHFPPPSNPKPISSPLTTFNQINCTPFQLQPITFNTYTTPPYSSLIQSCIDSHSFDDGKSIHAQMLAEGFVPDTYLQTKILMLYARSGDRSDLAIARRMFDEMTERNSTSWNTMILAYSRASEHPEVVDLFSRMRKDGIPPDKFTFPSVVKASIALDDAAAVPQVQTLIIKTGLNHNAVVGSAMVDGYTAFGLLDEAATTFDEIDGENVLAWNSIMGGYLKSSRWEEALGAFHRMLIIGVNPDHFTFATAIRACGALRSLTPGKQVHAKLVVHGYEGDIFAENSLIDMYAKCGDGESCTMVFELMNQRNQVSWNSIISSYTHLGYNEEALALFVTMQELGFKCDRFNLGSGLMASAGLAEIKIGREFHGYLVRRSLDSDFVLGSAVVDMYSKSGFIEDAHRAFDRLTERNEVSWNALITGYVQEEQADVAIELYRGMKSADILPDQFTFSSLLTLSADQGNADHGKQIHAHIIRTAARPTIVVETELVHMYAKCGRLNYAKQIFSRMPERNAYSWNSMIEGCEQNDRAMDALELFYQMQIDGVAPDCFSLASVLSACNNLSDVQKGKEIHGFIVKSMLEDHGVLRCMLVDMYAKCENMEYARKTYNARGKDVVLHNVMIAALISRGDIDEARSLFDKMEVRSTVSWNTILMGYAKGSLKDETFEVFQRMIEEGMDFDCLTLVPLFNLCASLPAIELGEQLHAIMIKKGLAHSSVVLDSSVVDMYGKSGSIEEARRQFDRMEVRNVVTWNAMISGYGKHGQSGEVFSLYKQMKSEHIEPNDVTFLSVLSACSHTGLVDEGINAFISMLEEHRIEARAEHYTCMVDLLGRAGLLEEAKEVMERMPVEPEVSTWGALLGACRIHKAVDLGRLAADNLFRLDPMNSGHYILMANIYAAVGRWEEADEVRELMRARGVKKEPGVSWIEIDSEIQTFHAGDHTHPQAKEIYATLKHLSWRMKGMGYVPDGEFVLRDVEECKEEYFLQHSERLAIGLGLIRLPEKSTVRVFKNLRICGDCHTAIKLMSKITGRRIVVRDTNRFHHFENGGCSCGDYW